MRLSCHLIICGLAFTLTPLGAQTAKPNLTGTWRLNSAKSHAAGVSEASLNIDHNGAKIHIVQSQKATDGKETKLEFTCTTDGKECDASGTKVSLWFDGNSLVEMEVGSDVIRKLSLKLAEDKGSLTVDITHIVPQGDAEALVLDKT
jgi:hypothetical protein